MGDRLLSKYQYGLEGDATPGTAVAATRKLGAAIKGVPMDRIWTPLKYANGSRAHANAKRNDTLQVRDSLTFDDTNSLYFQMLPFVFHHFLDEMAGVEQTGAQADYLYSIAPSMTAANDPGTFTLEMGDDTQAYEVEGCQFTRALIAWRIPTGADSAPATGEFSYFGRQMTPTTFTAGQSLHAGIVPANGKLSRLYKDSTWAGVGTTELTNTLVGAEIEILAGNHPKPFGSANKYFESWGEGELASMITLDIEGGANADAIYDDWQAGTERALRLQLNGPQIGTGLNYRFRWDVFGYFAEVVPLNESREGNNLHRALFVSQEDASNNMIRGEVITNNSTL
jgi:hypothetical protein